MKFSGNWLREFVELPPTVEELADLLTMAGVEIKGIEKKGADFAHVVVVQIDDSKPHPNADRLSVCQVNDGSGSARQIVCGAKNYQVGDKVPLALPGAELPGGLKIKASKLRGVESAGMLCSAKELALADDAAGLLILPRDAKIGAPISEVFPSDAILDVEITPNRGDLLSHFGLAREIAALTGRKLQREFSETRDGSEKKNSLQVTALREAPFYTLQKIENLKVAPSPAWLRAKLESVGLRSINNVVDISNFVMLELGQPTHAFDAAKIEGSVQVRLARDGEQLLALDGKTYSLRPHHLVIAGDARPVGLAGVMGGEDSGVTETTTIVLLESACFLPSSIRRTARELNLPSDASYRFERGIDPRLIVRASQRVVELLQEIAGGTATEPLLSAGDIPPDPAPVTLRPERIKQVLGIEVPPEKANSILTSFGLQQNGAWKIPSYRRDLQREVDLIEEIVRGFGLENIPSADRSRFTPLSAADRAYDAEMKIRGQLIALGLSEARTSSLIARSELARVTGAVALRNPLSEDHVALRTSLVSGLIASAARNLRGGVERVGLFELGNVFAPATGEQRRLLSMLLTGKTQSAAQWREQKKRALDFFDLKGALATIGTFAYRRREREGYAFAADLFLGKMPAGFAGQRNKSGVPESSDPVLVAEVDLAAVAAKPSRGFSEIDRFPAVTRDIAMFVPVEITHEKIVGAMMATKEPLLERVELFDLFAEKTAELARKSLAYSLTYRDRNRTLTGDEVNAAHARIRERLRTEVGAELRE